MEGGQGGLVDDFIDTLNCCRSDIDSIGGIHRFQETLSLVSIGSDDII